MTQPPDISNAGPGTAVPAASTTARNLLLAGLVLCFLGLFGKYTSGDAVTLLPLSLPGSTIQLTVQAPMVSGFALRPFAVYLIIGLAVVFLTTLRDNPFWQRYGYLVSAILLLCFCTLGGFLSIVGLLL